MPAAVRFVWDATKAAANYKKHKVTFDDAASAFRDRGALFEVDKDHPDRGNLIGVAATTRLLFVVHMEFDLDEANPVVRLISARKATRAERSRYEQAKS